MTVTIGLQTLSLGYFLNYEVSRGQLGLTLRLEKWDWSLVQVYLLKKVNKVAPSNNRD